ncbi:MAG: hypothetical protein ACLUR5_17325 [Eubacterium ventriosum]
MIIVAPHFLIHIFSSDSALIADAVSGAETLFCALLFLWICSIFGQTFFKITLTRRNMLFSSLLRKAVIVVPLTSHIPIFV